MTNYNGYEIRKTSFGKWEVLGFSYEGDGVQMNPTFRTKRAAMNFIDRRIAEKQAA